LPRNGQVRLQSYNGVHFVVESLVAKSQNLKVYFQDDRGKRVQVRKTDFYEDHEGGYGNAVLVVRPERMLAANTTYELVAEYLAWSREKEKEEVWTPVTIATYRTTSEVDREKPRWRARPTSETREEEDYDRRRKHDVVLAPVAREHELLHLVVELAPLGKGKKKRILLVYDPSRLCPQGPTADYGVAVANANCPTQGESGEICHTGTMYDMGKAEDSGRKFRVKLTAVDIAGNKRKAPGKGPVVRWTGTSITVCLKQDE